MENCKHERIVVIMGGWYCPDCGRVFNAKPEPPKEEPKPKKKTTKKKES